MGSTKLIISLVIAKKATLQFCYLGVWGGIIQDDMDYWKKSGFYTKYPFKILIRNFLRINVYLNSEYCLCLISKS